MRPADGAACVCAADGGLAKRRCLFATTVPLHRRYHYFAATTTSPMLTSASPLLATTSLLLTTTSPLLHRRLPLLLHRRLPPLRLCFTSTDFYFYFATASSLLTPTSPPLHPSSSPLLTSTSPLLHPSASPLLHRCLPPVRLHFAAASPLYFAAAYHYFAAAEPEPDPEPDPEPPLLTSNSPLLSPLFTSHLYLAAASSDFAATCPLFRRRLPLLHLYLTSTLPLHHL